MNKKGFTLVEVIVSFVLVTAVSIALFRTTVSIQQRQKANIALNSFKAFNLAINNEIQYDFLTDKILSANVCGTNCYDIEYESRGTIRITLDKANGVITYGPFKEKLPDDYTFYDDMTITSYSSESEGLNSYVALTIPVKSNYDPNLSNIKYIYEYDSAKSDETNLNLPGLNNVFANKVGSGGLFRDDHGDLRYNGSDPNNYVTFNGEIAGWRIIGIFDDRVKLVRKYSIGSFSWDSSDSTINGGYGINQWGVSGSYAGADLMKELNGDYLNSSLGANTNWYNGTNNAKSGTFNKSYVLNENAQKLIGDALWYTGGIESNSSLTLVDAYASERGTYGKMCSGGIDCSDEIVRTYTYMGKVGLIYISDFGYASGNTTGTDACKNNLSNGALYCGNNWMSNYGWTITPTSHSLYAQYIWRAGESNTGRYYASNDNAVHPVVYLKSNVKVAGEGTISNPYVFTINNSAQLNVDLNSVYQRIQNLDTLITNYENSTTEIQTVLNNLTDNTNSNNVFLKTYPVGSIYISNTNTNPGTIFGGTWTAFGTGRTLVGVDTSQTEFNTVEKTGGEKTHKLTVAEMPSHSHTSKGWAAVVDGSGSYITLGGAGSNTSYSTNAAGSSSAHNNLQPYITTYMWKRTN